MQTEALGLLRRVVVLRGRVLGHEEAVLDPAGDEQPSAEGAEEAEPLGLVVPRALDADRGRPRERDAAQLAATDVEGAVDEHVEREPGAGAELEQAHATRASVAERHEPDAGDLVEPSDPAGELAPREVVSEELRHGESLTWLDAPRSRLRWPVAPGGRVGGSVRRVAAVDRERLAGDEARARVAERDDGSRHVRRLGRAGPQASGRRPPARRRSRARSPRSPSASGSGPAGAAFTRTPRSAHSTARTRVRPTRPAFAAPYGARPGTRRRRR